MNRPPGVDSGRLLPHGICRASQSIRIPLDDSAIGQAIKRCVPDRLGRVGIDALVDSLRCQV